MINYKVPFYSNTPDDTHCFQAALKMVFKYFWPEKEFSWEELEKITAKAEGLWTWPFAGLIWTSNQGFKVVDIDMFDTDRFINEGGSYLIEEYGKEVGEAQIKHSNINQELVSAKEYLIKVSREKRIATFEDIKKFLSDGYLLICNVNSMALNNEEGYAGHFIIIKGMDKDSLYIHDPGLPPQEDRKINMKNFEKAWAHPDEKSKGLTALKLK